MNSIKSWRFALFFPALLTLVVTQASASNQIQNGTFGSGTAPWTLVLGGGAASFANDSGTGSVTITNSGGTSKSTVTLDQTLSGPLVNGATYTIEFDARAAANKPIDIMLRNSSAIFYSVYNVSVGTVSEHKTFTYTHTAADASDVRLSLRVGGNTTTVWFDNVEVNPPPTGLASQLLSKVNGVWQFNTLSKNSSGAWVNNNPVPVGKAWNVGTFDFSYVGYNYGENESFVGIPAASVTIVAAQYEDISDKIQNALDSSPLAAGGTVIIPAGTYYIGRNKTEKAIVVSKDNTVIKGAPGVGQTKLIVDKSYHPLPLTETDKDRQTATFASGVITFVKNTVVNGQTSSSGNWIYGSAPANAATVSVPVALGSRTITISDPSSTLASNLSTVMIRQIMWQSFVEAWAFNHSYAPKPWRWCTYNGDIPSFTDPSFAFTYYRKVISRDGNVLTLDAPIPHDLDPANAPITVMKKTLSYQLTNCGLQDLTFEAEEEQNDVPSPATLGEDSLGCTIQISGVYNGLFKNVKIESFRSLGFSTAYPIHVTFLNCKTANAQNCGGGGAGYGFYIKGQNLLYKNCVATNVRHGYTTAASQTSNIVLKDCSSSSYRFHTSVTTGGESVDDTHLQYAHGILWDNHYSNKAGMLMIPRKELSAKAYETCAWSIVWNYKNEGINDLDPYGKDLRHNLLGVTPTEFGMVIGAHAGTGGDGIRVRDGYTRGINATFQSSDWGIPVTGPELKVGTSSGRVLYEHTGEAVAESLYEIMFAKRGATAVP